MKIVYLESSLDDLEWMRFYYRNIFPAGKKQAAINIKTAEKLIIEHPNIGKDYDDINKVKEFVINKTPFTFLYRIKQERIEILRVWDQRGNRSSLRP